MKLKLDINADALYVKLKRGKVFKTESKGSYLVDYDKKGDIIGFEVLNFSKAVPNMAERKALAGVVIGNRSLANT